jgi:GT2 family glycosyltransferase
MADIDPENGLESETALETSIPLAELLNLPDLPDVADVADVACDQAPEPPAELPDGYEETRYLRAYPDVAAAVRAGAIASGLEHYLQFGETERRLDRLDYRHAWPILDSPHFPMHGVDAVFWTRSGLVMVIGWVNDIAAPLRSVGLMRDETLLGATAALARCRRQDAERAVGAAEGRLLGFWGVFRCRADVRPDGARMVLMTDAEQRAVAVAPQIVTEERLRELALEYLAGASYWGQPQVEAFGFLDRGLGATLIATNADLSGRIAAGGFCKRFGPARRFRASIVVCLYGRAEYMFLQAALFTRGADWRDHEFIYVSNSPELTERLCKEAELAARIYGVSISLVVLPGNAGFGMANNAAVVFAQSDRVMIVNPDVFPRDDGWAADHAAIVENVPQAQTRLFGAPLFYDDGALMHAGMYFELDEGFSLADGGISRRTLARVEHYGKGAPPGTARYLVSRPVPAVSGAFMSCDRAWFERMGGFSANYVFGHYEDADLCLRSLIAGGPVWLHHVPFWHMEGKGSARRPVHEGGSTVNRWYFTQIWAETIRDGLLGPAPARAELQGGLA